jgi:hypothetical protein
MGIANGLGVTGYRRTQSPPSLLEGAPAAFDTPLSTPMRNDLIAQISNVAIGTFDTDTDSIAVAIPLPDGTVVTHTTTRASNVPVDAAAAAVALAALIDGDDALVGHVDASTSTTNLVLTFLHPNVVYPVAATPSAGTTATVTTPTAAGGSAIPFGRFLVAGTTLDGITAMELPSASTVAADVIGVSARPIAQFPNAGSELASAVDGIPAGKMADAFYDGLVAMRNNGGVASAMGGAVHVVIATTGGDELGEARADASGAAYVSTLTPAANMLMYAVKASVNVNGREIPLAFEYTPTDGTTTADDAVDGLEDAAAAAITAAGLTGIVAASAASGATFTLTVAAGYAWATAPYFSAWSLDTEVVSGTVSTATATNYTIALPRTQARWAAVVPAGEVGPVAIDLI